jgi:tetratricopeptide (TPR) repeat protein
MAIMLLFSACSTRKDKWINRTYHSVTAHYNAYWNGNVALKDAIGTLDKNTQDDFTKILPVYRLGAAKDTNSIKSKTDRAIEKASKVITKHSMVFSGVEKNKRIPEAYLLIGRAAFYQRDYKTAEATFRFMLGKWKNDYNAMIWLAFTLCKQKKYPEAYSYLDQVRNKLGSGGSILGLGKNNSLRDFMYLVYIEAELAQGNNAKALEYMDMRKGSIFERKINNRLNFIKGQIYQRNNDYAQATKYFKKTARRSSSYDMQFASELNLAMCYDPTITKSSAIISKLKKMLPDKKNLEYCDQIYYALGEVYFRDKNVDTACYMWEISVDSSKNNNIQKIASALRLADTYYDVVFNYEKAQAYYDTALSVMPKDYPNYDNINSKQKVLISLVSNLRIINRWDSLMALSALPEAELNKKIDGWIAEYKRLEEEKAKKAALEAAAAERNSSMTNYNQPSSRSNWYFYVNSTVQTGRAEFQRIWGKRELEDNWRLSDKREISDFDDMAENSDSLSVADSINENGKDSKALTPMNRNYYTKDIPYTDAQKEIANKETAEALLAAGYIYYQGLNNYEKAITTFLDLHKRYPQYKQILPSSYHLYCIYEKIGQYPNANFYKNKILTEYPQSEFAMMLTNPDYFKEMAKNNSRAEQLYSTAYSSYIKKNYEQAIIESRKGKDSIRLGEYIPRFLYLEALSKGRLYGIDSLVVALNQIVVNYPTSEITPTIDNQLEYLRHNYNLAAINIKQKSNPSISESDSTISTKDTTKAKEEKPIIKEDDILDAESLVFRYKDMQHYYVLLFDDDKIDVTLLSKQVKAFNDSLYADKNLISSSMLFTISQQIITVKSFENIEQAMQYYNAIYTNVLHALPKDSFNHFVISVQNYPTFYSRKNIKSYLKFFRIMYLKSNNNTNQ